MNMAGFVFLAAVITCQETATQDLLSDIAPWCFATMQEHTFELGARAAVLSQMDQPAIIPHMAEYEGKRFPYEVKYSNSKSSQTPALNGSCITAYAAGQMMHEP